MNPKRNELSVDTIVSDEISEKSPTVQQSTLPEPTSSAFNFVQGSNSAEYEPQESIPILAKSAMKSKPPGREIPNRVTISPIDTIQSSLTSTLDSTILNTLHSLLDPNFHLSWESLSKTIAELLPNNSSQESILAAFDVLRKQPEYEMLDHLSLEQA